MNKFQAEIKKVEDKDATYIEIPFNVEEMFGAKRVKVRAMFDDIEYRGSIVKMGLDCHILGLTKEIRNKIGKGPGDLIEVTVVKDEEERVVDISEELQSIMESEQEVKQFWNGLSFSIQKKFAHSITSAKKEETRLKRVATVIGKLRHKEKM
ncbi:MAG TPA: hypothetical protein DCY20_07630 [Firmicutes bacterium]|nr:hypothetical protein [Bacillota bacterium]